MPRRSRRKVFRAFIGLGSNIPPRFDYLRCAAALMRQLPGTRVKKLSPVYETFPIGPRQMDFLNAAVEISTTLEPTQLLKALKKLEHDLGRRRGKHWGPREIDLDILLYGERQLRTKTLIVPHPRLHERRFILKPLLDLAPGLRHPISEEPFRTIYRRLTAPDQKIRLYQRRWN